MALVLREHNDTGFDWQDHVWQIYTKVSLNYIRAFACQSFVAESAYPLAVTTVYCQHISTYIGPITIDLYFADINGEPFDDVLATTTVTPTAYRGWRIAEWNPKYTFTLGLSYCYVFYMTTLSPYALGSYTYLYLTANQYLSGTEHQCHMTSLSPITAILPDEVWRQYQYPLTEPDWSIMFRNYEQTTLEVFVTDNLTVDTAIDGFVKEPLGICNITVVGSGALKGLIHNAAATFGGIGGTIASLFESQVALQLELLGQAAMIADIVGNHIPLGVSLTGSGGITSNLTGRIIYLAGWSHGQSWLGSNLLVMGSIPPDPPPILPRIVYLVGEINVVSDISGRFTGTWNLVTTPGAGGLTAQSTIGGWLMVGDQIRGSAPCASALVGTLSVTRSIAGSIEANGNLVGELYGLYGVIAVQSNLSGHLESSNDLRGILTVQSVITGSLLLKEEMRGEIDGQSWLGSGITGLFKVDRKLAGTIAAQSNVGGDSGAILGNYYPDFILSTSNIVPYFIQSFLLNNQYVTPYIRE